MVAVRCTAEYSIVVHQSLSVRSYLGEVGGQSLSAVGVEVHERGRQGRTRDAASHTQGHYAPPGGLSAVELRSEVCVHEQVRQVWVTHEGSLDAVQEAGANYAAALPDARTLSEINSPFELQKRI